MNDSSDDDARTVQVSGPALLGLVGAVFLLMWFYHSSEDGFIPILDHANLAFHEAGHPIFGIFGWTMGLLGGTLGQLTFPIVVFVTYLRKGMLEPAALGLIWLFQNVLNIARYVADARAQELPLVGNGDRLHDWHTLLSQWNALPKDISIARFLTGLAWTGMILTLAWVALVWLRTRDE
jgi:hypothetical protein